PTRSRVALEYLPAREARPDIRPRPLGHGSHMDPQRCLPGGTARHQPRDAPGSATDRAGCRANPRGGSDVSEDPEVRAVSHGGHLDRYGPRRPATPEPMPACPQDGRADVSADSGACGGGCEAAGALDALDGGTNENGGN